LALSYVTYDYVRPLAVAGSRRAASLPDLPTLGESGVDGVVLEGWDAIFAPARSPGHAISWLAERIGAAMDDPAVQSRLLALGLEPVTARRGQFATRIHGESERWAPLVRASRPFARAPES
jgi:tripartite-type tricarboxylate transporter receptor subunit TctC